MNFDTYLGKKLQIYELRGLKTGKNDVFIILLYTKDINVCTYALSEFAFRFKVFLQKSDLILKGKTNGGIG